MEIYIMLICGWCYMFYFYIFVGLELGIINELINEMKL